MNECGVPGYSFVRGSNNKSKLSSLMARGGLRLRYGLSMGSGLCSTQSIPLARSSCCWE
jgi:hypothetical protein